MGACPPTGTHYEVNEVGLLAPEPQPTGELLTGQVGYMLVGMKDTRSGGRACSTTLLLPACTALPGTVYRPACLAGAVMLLVDWP